LSCSANIIFYLCFSIIYAIQNERRFFAPRVAAFKKFAVANLQTTTGESIQILNSGQYLQLTGPDFFNAQIIIGNQKWAGNM
jgi:hypothetical protein